MKRMPFYLSLCCMIMHTAVLFAADGNPLTAPKPIINPQNDDEYFFNFRLAYFAPRTEALINEVFGDKLVLLTEGYWEYNSYTSHAVSFSTNLPSVSVIEYGETADYGQATVQSDSYYYQHLHYIKGLKPNTTYHYRVKVQDDGGNLVVSDDYTFTTREFTDEVIRIPEDIGGEAPYVLNQANKKYVLTQDLTVPTVAINIKAHDVELDLDGHTIVYDNGAPTVTGDWWNDYAYNEEATFGIRAGLWNYRNAKVFNGTIRQGSNGGMGYIGIGFNPLFLNHMGEGSYNEVAGITVDYYGASVTGMVAGNGYTHHNVIIDRGTVVDNRHQGIKAMTVGSNPENEIAYNSIRRFRHQGIMGSGKKHHNELYSDSFDSNSFLIGVGNSGRIEYNKMFGMGYNPVGTNWGSNTVISHNFIYLHGTAPSQRSTEYARLSGVAGVRYTLYGDDNTVYENSLYEDNTIILKAWAKCEIARGIWTATGDRNKGVIYRRNTVKVEAISDDIRFTDANIAVTAVDINGGNMPVDSPLPTPMIFEDNRLIGNVNLISFGSSYGIGGSSYFYRTKLERINRFDHYFEPVRLGYWNWNTRDNRIIDVIPGDGVDLTVAPDFHGSTGYMEVCYGETKELVLTGECGGEPIRNANVTITADGLDPIQVTTDNEGRISFEMLTVRHRKAGSAISRTDYSPYTFSVQGYPSCTIDTEIIQHKSVIAVNDPGCDTGTEDIIDDAYFIYPNPVGDAFRISGLQGGETVHLYDFAGKRIQSILMVNGDELVPVAHITAGTYLIRIIKDKQPVKVLTVIVK